MEEKYQTNSEEKDLVENTHINGVNVEFQKELIDAYNIHVSKIRPICKDIREYCGYVPVDNKINYVYDNGKIHREFDDEKELLLFIDEQQEVGKM